MGKLTLLYFSNKLIFIIKIFLNFANYKFIHSKKNMAKISIITISYNNLEGLRRTVPSVLSQTYNDYEYIVVDGGSNDGSKEYLESKSALITRWISEPDKGIYNAMNKGIAMATGEYCIFMNSGDHFLSAMVLEKAAPELDGTDYCVGRTIVMDEQYASLRMPPKSPTLRFLSDNALQHQSTFIKTKLLKEHPYDESLKIVADWAHFVENRYVRHHSYKSMDIVVAVFYLDGISFNQPKQVRTEFNLVLKRLFPNGLPKEKETKEQKQELLTAKVAYKLERAMRKSGLKRDLKILRNSIRFVLKDLFM